MSEGQWLSKSPTPWRTSMGRSGWLCCRRYVRALNSNLIFYLWQFLKKTKTKIKQSFNFFAVWRHYPHVCGEDGIQRLVSAWFPAASVHRPFTGQTVSEHFALKYEKHSWIRTFLQLPASDIVSDQVENWISLITLWETSQTMRWFQL